MNKDYTWIPKRREKEREIDEYFDVLKYMKYKGLYEKTKDLAKSREGVDLDRLTQENELRSRLSSKKKRELEDMKRWVKISMSDSWNVDEEEAKWKLDLINERLGKISADKIAVEAGPITMRALQYKKQYESTLYGADPHGDLLDIYKALPKKDRPFFQHFMTANPREREEILRLVPKNQRRFYQAKFGLNVDDKPELSDYFKSHSLPGPSWEGWRPDKSLEEIKLKFVKNEAMDISEFGFYETDLDHVGMSTPNIGSMRRFNLGSLDTGKIRKVLQGAGISNADIQIQSVIVDKAEDLFNVSMNLFYDRRQDINDAINENISYLITD